MDSTSPLCCLKNKLAKVSRAAGERAIEPPPRLLRALRSPLSLLRLPVVPANQDVFYPLCSRLVVYYYSE